MRLVGSIANAVVPIVAVKWVVVLLVEVCDSSSFRSRERNCVFLVVVVSEWGVLLLVDRLLHLAMVPLPMDHVSNTGMF